ncbi:MAG: hypothetical protein LBK58_03110 [Prevotellaceae bacterium]|nr:hypothetical protein [Prevotellaceae bacterium]
MKQCIKFTEQYAGIGGRTGKLSIRAEVFSKKAIYVLIALCMTVIFSCRKDYDKDDDGADDTEMEEIDILGTWTAAPGKYNLSFTITPTNYDFSLTEAGKGGIYDNGGTYEISRDGIILFTASYGDPYATGQLINGKLHITVLNNILINMLGTAAASNTVFSRSEEGTGSLVIQNLSTSYDIVSIKFYDMDGTFIDSDSDVLEPGYQFGYTVNVGSYTVEVADDRKKSFRSKSFTIIKDKLTVLGYSGSAINILATGLKDED